MSKTRQNKQLRNQIAKLELINESQTKEIIALKKQLYDMQKEREAFIEDLKLLRDLHNIPANLQTQAG